MPFVEGKVNAETPLLSEGKALWNSGKERFTEGSDSMETPVDIFPMRTWHLT